MVRNTQKSEKWEINAVGPGLWQEKKKQGKWETNTWNMMRNIEYVYMRNIEYILYNI